MKRAAAFRLWLLLLACSIAGTQTVANKQSVLSQARQSYYNLRTEGLSSFECSVTPNWQLLLQKESQQNPDAAAAAIKTLSQLHFTVNLAPDNSVKLTHNELAGQSDDMKAALTRIYQGMEQIASGFFDTWKIFMLSPPFPDVDKPFQLEAAGPQYRLTYRDELADVVTTMARDFAISNLQVTTPNFDSSIQPSFSRTPKGFLISGYEASYKSQKPEETTDLKVSMDYQDVQGFKMLQKLSLNGVYGGSPFAVELAFSDCQVMKKQ